MSTTRDGGKPNVRDLNYSPPVGPRNNNSPGPGLRGGTNFGHCQCMDDGTPKSSGSVSAGMNHSNSPAQGKR